MGAGTKDDPWVLKTPPGSSSTYLPPLLEELGLAEVSDDPRNNEMKAK